jgi:hypothetical protein
VIAQAVGARGEGDDLLEIHVAARPGLEAELRRGRRAGSAGR